MNAEERMRAILNADAKTLAAVDEALAGDGGVPYRIIGRRELAERFNVSASTLDKMAEGLPLVKVYSPRSKGKLKPKALGFTEESARRAFDAMVRREAQ